MFIVSALMGVSNLLEVGEEIMPSPAATRIEVFPCVVISSRASGPDHAIQDCTASNSSSLVERSGIVVKKLLWCRREVCIVDRA